MRQFESLFIIQILLILILEKFMIYHYITVG